METKRVNILLFWVSLLSIIVLMSIVLAIQIINFDSSLSPVNVSFTGNENITFNITLYKNANVTSASLNLSGYPSLNSPSNMSLTTSYYSYSGSPNNPTYGNDTNWSTLTSAAFSFFIYLNYTFENANLVGEIYYNTAQQAACGVQTNNEIYCLNWSSKLYSNKYEYFCVNNGNMLSYLLPDGCINRTANSSQQALSIRSDINSAFSVGVGFYEGNITIGNKTYPTNINLTINNTSIWNYNNQFNQTNNKTLDFSSNLNNATNLGTCNCAGCSLSGNNCTIPFTFHSDTAGILQVSDININWLEYTQPNIIIYHPNQSYNLITYIPLNYSVSDDWQIGSCVYNVTRGASLEVANTNIPNCLNTTFTVTGDANYVLHFCVNDTSNNKNCTSSSFSTINYISPPSPPGGGGGGEPIVQNITLVYNNTFCGDKICQVNGNDLGVKEDYFSCAQDCPPANIDTAIFGCFDNDASSPCVWEQLSFQMIGLFIVMLGLVLAFSTTDYSGRQIPLYRYVYLRSKRSRRRR